MTAELRRSPRNRQTAWTTRYLSSARSRTETAPRSEPSDGGTPERMGKTAGRRNAQDDRVAVQGTVETVGTYQPPGGQDFDGLRLRVRTQDRGPVIVHAGPRSYAEEQEMRFHPGDAVTITGSRRMFGDREVIVATQIEKDGDVLRLRSRQGRPLWSTGEGTR